MQKHWNWRDTMHTLVCQETFRRESQVAMNLMPNTLGFLEREATPHFQEKQILTY